MGVLDRDTESSQPAPATARAPTRRTRAALALAAVSFAASILGALGPSDAVRSTYTWPPRSVPAKTPERFWYTPLLLNRQTPESVSVRIPCSLPPALPGADQPTTILATARDPLASGGLVVSRTEDLLSVRVGGQLLGEVSLSGSRPTDAACEYRIRLAGGEWSIEGGPEASTLSGNLGAMPVVFGLFSALDLRSPAPPTIDVTTTVHDTRTTSRQAVSWIAAVVGLLAALLLLCTPGSPRRMWVPARQGFEAAARHAHLADAVVGITLVGWWVLAPVVWDDGWVVARERTLSSSGGFSTYFNAFGVNLPLDYWVEWLHHWIADRTTDILVLRFHALVALAVTWVLCRWAFSAVSTAHQRRWSAGLWALASAFLVGALAWDMAIRPEPATALLAMGVAACAIRFAERETVVPLALAALLIPLALTAHHTGIVALAPVLAVTPQLVHWARSRLTVLAALLISAISWTVVLGFVGSDAGQRLEDARATANYGITSSWRDELERYALLDTFPWATPLRRASVALIGLALLSFLLRRRGDRRLVVLPATMLTIALALLVVTPSKIPWHFGALTGLVALTVGAEVVRIRQMEMRSRGWQLLPYLLIGAAIAAAAWSWSPRAGWNPVDLRTVSWNPGLEAVFPFATLAVVLPGLVLGGTMLLGLRRGRRFGGSGAPWSVAAWTAVLFAGPLIIFTVTVLSADVVRTDGWTLAGQNLDSIRGRAGCGLGDDAVASLWDTSSSLTALKGARVVSPGTWVPAAPVTGLPRFELSSSSSTPWFRLPADRRVGLFVAGSRAGELMLEWGRLQRGRVDVLRSDTLFAVQPRIEASPWVFLAASELPTPDSQANVVRIATLPSAVPAAPLAVTAPVTYRTERLSRLLGQAGAGSLIHPNLLLYFPCARQPELAQGVAEVPRYFVWFDSNFQPHPYESTSPFLGVHDLYPVERLPLTDGVSPPFGVVVYEVDTRVSDSERLPPDARAVVS